MLYIGMRAWRRGGWLRGSATNGMAYRFDCDPYTNLRVISKLGAPCNSAFSAAAPLRMPGIEAICLNSYQTGVQTRPQIYPISQMGIWIYLEMSYNRTQHVGVFILYGSRHFLGNAKSP